MKCTKKDLLKRLKGLATFLGVTVRFFNKKPVKWERGTLGQAWLIEGDMTGDIAVRTDFSKDIIISTFLHEYAHKYVWQQDGYTFPFKKEKGWRQLLRYERRVDRLAERVGRTLFPKLKYRKGYQTKQAIHSLKKEWERCYGRRN